MEFPALRRPGSSASGTHTSDHRAYRRATPAPVPPFSYGAGTPLVFLVRHDLRRCAPFGVFDVYVGARGYTLVGTLLSCPSYDDCRRLLRQAGARGCIQSHNRYDGATATLPHTTRSR